MFQFISSSRPSLIASQIFAIRVTSSSVCQFTSRNVHVSTHLVVKREERMNNQGIKIITGFSRGIDLSTNDSRLSRRSIESDRVIESDDERRYLTINLNFSRRDRQVIFRTSYLNYLYFCSQLYTCNNLYGEISSCITHEDS